MTDERAVEHEVIRLHRFIEGWFNGRDGLSMSEFTRVLGDEFSIVSPSGEVAGRDEIISAVDAAFDSSAVEIRVEDVWTLVFDDSALCRYVEVHQRGSETSRRISTTVFRFERDENRQPIWVTVHETWTAS